MTRKHKIIFILKKIVLYVTGVRTGRKVKSYSTGKDKWIQGIITGIEGTSIHSKKLGINIDIEWLEPFEGNDEKYYKKANPTIKQFVDDFEFIK